MLPVSLDCFYLVFQGTQDEEKQDKNNLEKQAT
jgi:hypothetical protein